MNVDIASAWAQILSVGFELAAIAYAGFKFFTRLNARLERLEQEYKPNGGSSMRDAINRIEVNLAKLEGKFEQHVDEAE